MQGIASRLAELGRRRLVDLTGYEDYLARLPIPVGPASAAPPHRLTADEVIFITFHDSDHNRAWRAPHTAFHDTTRPDTHTRESYEFRAIAYFD